MCIRDSFCSYPSFIDCCRTAVRMEEQMQLSHSLLCCELLDRKGNPLEERREDAEQELKQIFGEVLRRGDIYTCYSIGQYLVPVSYTHLDVYKRQPGFPAGRKELSD